MKDFLYDVFSVVSVICGIICCILSIFAAGKADYYIEMHQAVPGDIDLKMVSVGIVFGLVGLLCIYIMKYWEGNEVIDLREIPLYCTRGIKTKMEESGIFENQLDRCLEKYFNCEWGNLSEEDKEMNDSAFENGDDRILAMYKTVMGNIYIITEADQSATTVLFADEY